MPRIVYTDISGQERSVPFGVDFPVVTIGRATDCTIRSNRKSVSRRHAEFRYSNGQFEIIDLNSSNGTFVIINNERKPVVGREFLALNDEVWCGDFILHFIEDEDDPHTAAEGPFDGYGAPTQNGGNPSFSLNTNPNHFGNEYNEPFHPSTFDDIGRGIDDVSSVAWGSTHPPAGVPNADMTLERSASSGELERLRAEKKSIEELAARQSAELEDLQRKLDAERRKADELEARSERTSNIPLGDIQRLRDDVARLEEEKQEVEEKLGKQANEARRFASELETIRDEKRRLEEKLHTALQNADRAQDAEARLEELRRRNQNMEQELDDALTRIVELEDHLNAQANALEERQRYKEEVLSRNREIETLEQQVTRLQTDLAAQLKKTQETAAHLEKGLRAIEETDALRREVDRHKRLVEEFERRNQELQLDLDESRQSSDAVRAVTAEFENKLDDIESELEATRAELEAMRRDKERVQNDLQRAQDETAQAQKAMTELQARGNIDDLRVEIEGLKQRLKLEKERSKSDDRIAKLNEDLKAQIETLQAEIKRLENQHKHALEEAARAQDTALESQHAQLQNLFEQERARLSSDLDAAHQNAEELRTQANLIESHLKDQALQLQAEINRLQAELDAVPVPTGTAADNLPPDVLKQFRSRVEKLDRIVDAIERANLDALSTVDRIRLQSALRDTEPRVSLAHLKSLLGD